MNKKHKCKFCGEYSDKTILTNVGQFCEDTDCAYQWVLQDRERKRQKLIAKAYAPKRGRKKGKTKKDCDNDLKTRKASAKKACHDYIRERDKNELCICCDRPLGDNFQAGHFWESGNYPMIRYDEDNIHGQRLDCNLFKGGDSGHYRENLIKKIGIERVERLDRIRSKPIKRTAQDYKEIEIYYKDKLKKLTGQSS